jgi:hypothetical protein
VPGNFRRHERTVPSDRGQFHITSVVTAPTFKPQPGDPQRLFETLVPDGVSPYRSRYEVSKDGKRFLVFTQTNKNAPTGITTVLNWTAALER